MSVYQLTHELNDARDLIEQMKQAILGYKREIDRIKLNKRQLEFEKNESDQVKRELYTESELQGSLNELEKLSEMQRQELLLIQGERDTLKEQCTELSDVIREASTTIQREFETIDDLQVQKESCNQNNIKLNEQISELQTELQMALETQHFLQSNAQQQDFPPIQQEVPFILENTLAPINLSNEQQEFDGRQLSQVENEMTCQNNLGHEEECTDNEEGVNLQNETFELNDKYNQQTNAENEQNAEPPLYSNSEQINLIPADQNAEIEAIEQRAEKLLSQSSTKPSLKEPNYSVPNYKADGEHINCQTGKNSKGVQSPELFKSEIVKSIFEASTPELNESVSQLLDDSNFLKKHCEICSKVKEEQSPTTSDQNDMDKTNEMINALKSNTFDEKAKAPHNDPPESPVKMYRISEQYDVNNSIDKEEEILDINDVISENLALQEDLFIAKAELQQIRKQEK